MSVTVFRLRSTLNERQSLLDGIMDVQVMVDVRYYYFRFPGLPTLDSDHAECM